MKVKLVDKYGFTKIVLLKDKTKTIELVTSVGIVSFELFDIAKRALPVFKQSSDLE